MLSEAKGDDSGALSATDSESLTMDKSTPPAEAGSLTGFRHFASIAPTGIFPS
ncbi:MAG: hypothetical protein QM770_04765 [Tepidisphaeraceae bacterium]